MIERRRPVVLTKPKEQQAPWREALEAEGWPVLSLPLLDLRALPDDAATRDVWARLDEYRGVIAVSPFAAGILAEKLDTWWPQPPVGIHWVTPGEGTATPLLDRFPELSVTWPAGGTTAEDVLARIRSTVVPGDHWLIVAGTGGRTVLSEGLEALGARVERLSVYERTPLPVTEEMDRKLASLSPIVQISSLTALTHLTSHTRPITKQNALLLLSSGRLSAAGNSWPNHLRADGASLQSTLTALQSLNHEHRTLTHGE